MMMMMSLLYGYPRAIMMARNTTTIRTRAFILNREFVCQVGKIGYRGGMRPITPHCGCLFFFIGADCYILLLLSISIVVVFITFVAEYIERVSRLTTSLLDR